MAATRLSDSQKTELVERFRAGQATQALANAFGCSAATVSRTVRAALDPGEYDRLKQPSGRRPASASTTAAINTTAAATAAAAGPPHESLSPGDTAGDGDSADASLSADESLSTGDSASAGSSLAAPAAPEPAAEAGRRSVGAVRRGGDREDDEAPGVLAIDDADDFGGEDEEDDEDLLAEAEEEDQAEAALAAMRALGITGREGEAVEVRPLMEAALPASAYMLVDKTVELQARPLSDFPELGALTPEEQERQALVVFLNPRQAKRQCGRSQRVIKLPDLTVLERAARFLLAQGISRVLIEGALYSLPGS